MSSGYADRMMARFFSVGPTRGFASIRLRRHFLLPSGPPTRTSLALVLLIATCTNCKPADRWGTPAYFERLTGTAFAPDSESIRCQKETGFDVVAFAKVRLPKEALDRLRARTALLSEFPHQMDYERDRRLRKWATGALSTEAHEALHLALEGAVASIDETDCGAAPSAQAEASVVRAMGGPMTFYTYQFKPIAGEVVSEALEFRVLDLESGVLYELVNFS